jgi:hypothetical protein
MSILLSGVALYWLAASVLSHVCVYVYSYEEEDTCLCLFVGGGGYMHEEDTWVCSSRKVRGTLIGIPILSDKRKQYHRRGGGRGGFIHVQRHYKGASSCCISLFLTHGECTHSLTYTCVRKHARTQPDVKRDARDSTRRSLPANFSQALT